MRDFDTLVAEATAADVSGWEFDRLNGRANEERPPWGFERHRDKLLELDKQVGAGSPFVAHSTRHLIEATAS